jgi:hypothetical protein
MYVTGEGAVGDAMEGILPFVVGAMGLMVGVVGDGVADFRGMVLNLVDDGETTWHSG